MNNLSSYCGLVDAQIRASDKDLPVRSKGESLAFSHLNPDPHGYKKSKKLCLHDQTLLLQLIKWKILLLLRSLVILLGLV